MRKAYQAPVDTMGCGQEYAKKVSKEDAAYHTLISLMLSAQTKDEVTHATTEYLVTEKNLSVKTILKTKTQDLNTWIAKVGFHNKKAEYIKKATQELQDKHDGKVPKNYKALIALPGVGPKMAHLVMQEAFGETVGVSVDTHVHRICDRIGWTKKATTPGKTADQLEQWLPKEKWGQANHMLVGFGQTVCKPIGPRCYECKIRDLCPMTGKTKSPEEKRIASKKSKEEAKE